LYIQQYLFYIMKFSYYFPLVIYVFSAVSFHGISAKESCFTTGRGACWSHGFKDNLSTPEECQRSCALTPGCEFFSYHPSRGDKRCHFCSNDSDWSSCKSNPKEDCIHGPVSCPGDERTGVLSILESAISTAEEFCGDSAREKNRESYKRAGMDLNTIILNKEVYDQKVQGFSSIYSKAVERAAAILSKSDECVPKATACNSGLLLIFNLQGMVILSDKNSTRALVGEVNKQHRKLYKSHKVLIADGWFFNKDSWAALRDFFSKIPDRLLREGILYEAPFAVMTVKDAYACEKDKSAGSALRITKRGWNVFKNQVGDWTENAFAKTPYTREGDILMTVTRHEVAH